MEGTTMATILETIGSVVTSAVGWMGTVFDEITAEPILMLFCVAVPLVGLGVGLAKRMISIN